MRVRQETIDHPRLQEILRYALHLDNPVPLLNYARQSEVMIAYWAEEELIAIAGFIPLDLFNITAYLWMESAPAVAKYKIAVGRWGIRAIREALGRYHRIVGHCLVGSRSVRWLESLGARFDTPAGPGIPFVIGH